MDKTTDLVMEWMHKAAHDLGMALLALKNRPDFADAICFHPKNGYCPRSSRRKTKETRMIP